MSALVRLLYPLPPLSRSPLRVVAWWERRRLHFNLIVGATGVFSLLAINAISMVPPGAGLGRIPLGLVALYAVVANFFYSAGWAVELAFNAWWKDDPPPIGPFLFRQGLLFSIGLTLLPVGIAAFGWGFRILRLLF